MKTSHLSLEKAKRTSAGMIKVLTKVRRKEAVLKTVALQNAILNSANFSSIDTINIKAKGETNTWFLNSCNGEAFHSSWFRNNSG